MFRRHVTPLRDQPWHDEVRAPRVLIEDSDGAYSWARARELRDAGFSVAVCDGPDPAGCVDCTLVRDGSCELAARADVILSNIRMSAGGAELLAALREHLPATPVARECTDQERVRDAAMLDDVSLVPFPATRAEMLATIRSLVPAP